MGAVRFREERLTRRNVVAVVSSSIILAMGSVTVAQGHLRGLVAIVVFGLGLLVTAARIASPQTVSISPDAIEVRAAFRSTTFERSACHGFRRARLGRVDVVVFVERTTRRRFRLSDQRARELGANRWLRVPTNVRPDEVLAAIKRSGNAGQVSGTAAGGSEPSASTT